MLHLEFITERLYRQLGALRTSTSRRRLASETLKLRSGGVKMPTTVSGKSSMICRRYSRGARGGNMQIAAGCARRGVGETQRIPEAERARDARKRQHVLLALVDGSLAALGGLEGGRAALRRLRTPRGGNT